MQPKIGQFIYIDITTTYDQKQNEEMYKAKIADLTEDTIAIEVPIHTNTGIQHRLYIGENVSAYFMSEGGIKNYFTTEVLGFREDVVRLIVIRRPTPTDLSRIQRRNFLRVPAELDVAVQVGNMKFVGVTEDLSGGGFAFLCENKHSLDAEQKISCWLLLQFRNQQIEHIPFEGEILRIKPLQNHMQLVMVRYSEIAESERQKIVRYCYERQMELRKY